MPVHRCPKHDVLFDSQKPPTQDGHQKCPLCNPPTVEKKDAQGKAEPVAPSQTAGID